MVKYLSMREKGKTSWPAATGVWVVKTVVEFCTCSSGIGKAVIPSLDSLPDPLQDCEGGMAFVQMENGMLDAHLGVKHFPAADPEDDFLPQSLLLVSRIEMSGNHPCSRDR